MLILFEGVGFSGKTSCINGLIQQYQQYKKIDELYFSPEILDLPYCMQNDQYKLNMAMTAMDKNPNDIILMDRSFLSTTIYCLLDNGWVNIDLNRLESILLKIDPQKTYIFYFSIDECVGIVRGKQTDRLSNSQIWYKDFKRTNLLYLELIYKLFPPNNIILIDANKKLSEVVLNVNNIIKWLKENDLLLWKDRH